MTRRYQFAAQLLDWYDRERRSLPWRDTTDPYAVLVSEVMLQQTQVSRVVPAWRAFLERFPTAAALAVAPRVEVLKLWRGLGYNRRAVSLHRAAQAIVSKHGGQVPGDLDALTALPGVGTYTARAVLAFAFSLPAAPVDTNVGRVLARAVAGDALTGRAAQELADVMVPADRPTSWSQALMDLGALVCTARAPRCPVCPVADACAWLASSQRDDPAAATAGSSRPQGRFADSDRFHRGRLVDVLRAGALEETRVPGAAQLAHQPERAARLLAALIAEGLVERRGDAVQLPG